jgi:K+/H+ antiporter YhaU regulatory subunit KhtT
MISQQAHIKLAKRGVGRLAGQHPLESSIRERTGCTIVAVERDREVIMDIASAFTLGEADELYVCGTVDALNRFNQAFHD